MLITSSVVSGPIHSLRVHNILWCWLGLPAAGMRLLLCIAMMVLVPGSYLAGSVERTVRKEGCYTWLLGLRYRTPHAETFLHAGTDG